MRTFELVRHADASGVSGTGVVAQGCEFDTGDCVLAWLTNTRSIALYRSIVELEHIHGHGGSTEIVFHQNKAEKVLKDVAGMLKSEFS